MSKKKSPTPAPEAEGLVAQLVAAPKKAADPADEMVAALRAISDAPRTDDAKRLDECRAELEPLVTRIKAARDAVVAFRKEHMPFLERLRQLDWAILLASAPNSAQRVWSVVNQLAETVERASDSTASSLFLFNRELASLTTKNFGQVRETLKLYAAQETLVEGWSRELADLKSHHLPALVEGLRNNPKGNLIWLAKLPERERRQERAVTEFDPFTWEQEKGGRS